MLAGFDRRDLGATLLVVGTAMGGAMLALPLVVAGHHGLATWAHFVLLWLYMLVGALAWLEVNLIMGRAHLLSMTRVTLGPVVAFVSGLVYLALLYSLLSAYVAVLSDFVHQITGTWYRHPDWLDKLSVIGFFVMVLQRGLAGVDRFNQPLIVLKMVLLTLLCQQLWPHATARSCAVVSYDHATSMTILTAFGFSVVVPSMCRYLDFAPQRLSRVIILGSIIPLLAYLTWCSLVQGVLGCADHSSVSVLLAALAEATGGAYFEGVAHVFAFLCVVTSLLGVAVSLLDFCQDGLRQRAWSLSSGRLVTLMFIPVIVINLATPQWFLWGLKFAGVCCVWLLGLLPVWMVAVMRYRQHRQGPYRVPGGALCLAIHALMSCYGLFSPLWHALTMD